MVPCDEMRMWWLVMKFWLWGQVLQVQVALFVPMSRFGLQWAGTDRDIVTHFTNNTDNRQT